MIFHKNKGKVSSVSTFVGASLVAASFFVTPAYAGIGSKSGGFSGGFGGGTKSVFSTPSFPSTNTNRTSSWGNNTSSTPITASKPVTSSSTSTSTSITRTPTAATSNLSSAARTKPADPIPSKKTPIASAISSIGESEQDSTKKKTVVKTVVAAGAGAAAATVVTSSTAKAAQESSLKAKASEPAKFGLPERNKELNSKDLSRMKPQNLVPRDKAVAARVTHYEDTAFRLTGSRILSYMLLSDHPGLCAVVAGGGSMHNFVLDYIICSALASNHKQQEAAQMKAAQDSLATQLNPPQLEGVQPAQNTADVKNLSGEFVNIEEKAKSVSDGAAAK